MSELETLEIVMELVRQHQKSRDIRCDGILRRIEEKLNPRPRTIHARPWIQFNRVIDSSTTSGR